jgi:hypothetical protein
LFRDSLLTVAKHSILAGYMQDCVPGLSREVMEKIEQRDEVRRAEPHDPVITQLNGEIASSITESRSRLWREKVESAGSGADTKKLWRIVRSLNSKRKFLPPNQPISFGPTTYSDRKVIADKFIRQYTPPPKSTSSFQWTTLMSHSLQGRSTRHSGLPATLWPQGLTG